MRVLCLILAPLAALAVKCKDYKSDMQGCTYCWNSAKCPPGYRYHSYDKCGPLHWYCHSKCVKEFDWPCASCGQLCPTPPPTLAPYTPPVAEPGVGFIGDSLDTSKTEGVYLVNEDNGKVLMYAKGRAAAYLAVVASPGDVEKHRRQLWVWTNGILSPLTDPAVRGYLYYPETGMGSLLFKRGAAGEKFRYDPELRRIWREHVGPKSSEPKFAQARNKSPSYLCNERNLCWGTAGIEYSKLSSKRKCEGAGGKAEAGDLRTCMDHCDADPKCVAIGFSKGEHCIKYDTGNPKCNNSQKSFVDTYRKPKATSKWRIKSVAELFPETREGEPDYFYIANEQTHQVVTGYEKPGAFPVHTWVPEGGDRQLWRWGEGGQLVNKAGEALEMADHRIAKIYIPANAKAGDNMDVKFPDGVTTHMKFQERYMAMRGTTTWVANPPEKLLNGVFSQDIVTTDVDVLDGINQQWFWSGGEIVTGFNQRCFDIPEKTGDGLGGHIGIDMTMQKRGDWTHWSRQFYLVPEELTRDFVDMISILNDPEEAAKGVSPLKKAYLYNTIARKHIDSVIGMSPEFLVARASYVGQTLRKMADEIAKSGKDAAISQIAAGSAGIFGAVLAFLGIALSGFTWGASLGLTLTGGIISVTPTMVYTVLDNKHDLSEQGMKNYVDALARTVNSGTSALSSFLDQYVDVMQELGEYVETPAGKDDLVEIYDYTTQTDIWTDMIVRWGVSSWNLGMYLNQKRTTFTTAKNLVGMKHMLASMGSYGWTAASLGAGYADDLAYGTGKFIHSIVEFIFPDAFFGGRVFTQSVQGVAGAIGLAFSVWGLVDGIDALDGNLKYSETLRDSADWLENGVPEMYRALMKLSGGYATMKIFDEQSSQMEAQLQMLLDGSVDLSADQKKQLKDLEALQGFSFEDDSWRELKRTYRKGKYTLDSNIFGNVKDMQKDDSLFAIDLYDVKNQGKNCWVPCGNIAGSCPSYCGNDGACCRKGWKNDPPTCGGSGGAAEAIQGSGNFHTCVLKNQKPTGRRRLLESEVGVASEGPALPESRI